MLFARWQHHLRFVSGFPYAPLKAMVTKISKWSRIQDSFRITTKIEPLVVCAIPDIRRKFQKDPSITSWVILLTDRQTTKSGKNITSLVEVMIMHQLGLEGKSQSILARLERPATIPTCISEDFYSGAALQCGFVTRQFASCWLNITPTFVLLSQFYTPFRNRVLKV